MFKKNWLATCALALTIGGSSNAALASYGYCSQPMAPSTYLNKPSKPYCATAGTCKQWDVDNYKNQVNSYYDSLNRYAREVDDYYEQASRYVKCMADLD